jgi:hypothetical protein
MPIRSYNKKAIRIERAGTRATEQEVRDLQMDRRQGSIPSSTTHPRKKRWKISCSMLKRISGKRSGNSGKISTLLSTAAPPEQQRTIDTDEYLTLIYKYLSDSKEIDGVVLLGLDALYDPESGELDKKKTDGVVTKN